MCHGLGIKCFCRCIGAEINSKKKSKCDQKLRDCCMLARSENSRATKGYALSSPGSARCNQFICVACPFRGVCVAQPPLIWNASLARRPDAESGRDACQWRMDANCSTNGQPIS